MVKKISIKELEEFSGIVLEAIKKERKDCTDQWKKGGWDSCARSFIFKFIIERFKKHFKVSTEEAKKYVYVEGQNPIPDAKRGASFFKSKMYPDAALIIPEKNFSIAIELDHGTKGSQIRNALSKAGFSVILEGYDKALVLFFVDSPKSANNFNVQDNEKILDLFKKDFNTELYLI